jgi:hypothetical protein
MRLQNKIEDEALYTPGELARLLHISANTVRLHMRNGDVDFIQPSPRKRYIRGEDWKEYQATLKEGVK